MKLSTALSLFTKICLLATILLLAAPCFGQGPPDCQWTDPYTSAATGPTHANTSLGVPCVAFRLTYDAIDMTAVSIQIEGAPWNSAGTGPGTFVGLATYWPVTFIVPPGWYFRLSSSGATSGWALSGGQEECY
jgi:hypothetical protein